MTSFSMLAVIPARGGSKGLPGKNVRALCGLPLLAHSLQCAARSEAISRVIVSTDDPDIARVAREHGGIAPFLRPADLARDDTPMIPVLVHALRRMEELDGCRYETLLLLDPTSPGRLPEDIARAAEMLREDPTADGVVACSRPTFNPYWVGVTVRERYLAHAFDAGSAHARRQDVPPFFRINGALYLWRREFLLGAGDRWLASGRFLMHEIPEGRAFSVDDEYEFRLLEAVMRAGLLPLPWLREGADPAGPAGKTEVPRSAPDRR